MCLLLETIRIENGQPQNLPFHNARMNTARKHFWHCNETINLEAILAAHMSSSGIKIQRQKDTGFQSKSEEQKDIIKCRVIYGRTVQKIDFLPYKLPSINSLKIVADDQIVYNYKYVDRKKINELFKKRSDCDDILIIKKGLVTDSSYANVLFYNGKNWLTPTHPLLKGTQRAHLLDKELIQVADIRPEDLSKFQHARLINAMIRFEDALDINILNICA